MVLDQPLEGGCRASWNQRLRIISSEASFRGLAYKICNFFDSSGKSSPQLFLRKGQCSVNKYVVIKPNKLIEEGLTLSDSQRKGTFGQPLEINERAT